MRTIERTKGTYTFAGLTTMARQTLFQIDSYFDILRKSKGITGKIFNTSLHTARIAETLTTRAVNHAVTLTEQQAYPILLQLSNENEELIEKTLIEEEKKLAILEALVPLLATLNPLAWISYGNFIEAFKAQMECHQTVLDHYHESWEWRDVKVQEVIDGDTIYVYGIKDSIRFCGIDCPEIWHTNDPGSPGDERYKGGWAAMYYTTDRLLEKNIRIKLYTKRDIYDRRLAKIYIGGKSFETELVREGHAKFKYYR